MSERLDLDPAAVTFVIPSQPVRARRRSELHREAAEAIVLAAYDAHERDLHAFGRSLTREPEAAQDIVADAFVRLVREVDAGRAPDELRGWLYRVVANLVLSRGRRLATAKRFIGRLVDRRVEESPEAHLIRAEIRDDLLDALAALPAEARVCVVMAARGATGREMAAAIGRSEAATRTLLCRARIRLRERLERGVKR